MENMSNYKRVDLIDIPCLMSPPRGGRHIVKREGRLFFKPWLTPAILSLVDTFSLLPMFWSNPSRSFFSSSTEFTAWAYYTVWFTLYNCIYYTHEIKLMISSQLSNCIHMLPLLCLFSALKPSGQSSAYLGKERMLKKFNSCIGSLEEKIE